MSEVMLNVIDAQRAICGSLHGSVVGTIIAALSAEPETIAELEAAVARFIKPSIEANLFSRFRSGTCQQAWDAGIVFIDLAARIVCAESSYSAPQRDGQVSTHDGAQATEVMIPYRLPDDWRFVSALPEYEGLAQQQREARAAHPPLDLRQVLYNDVIAFIAEACLAARAAGATDPIAEIHARWLMTARDDLRGQSPRAVMLAKREFIDFDLHSRELQWSFTGQCPPCLSMDSLAYRFAGFGTHEVVLYYDLMRWLLENCWQRACEEPEMTIESEMARLERLRDGWFRKPQNDLDGRNPAYVIDCERQRLPMALPASAAVVDEDCALCEMLGETDMPGFWHLDGCNMDDEFAFSFFRTKAEWEAEQSRWQEFNQRFEQVYSKGHVFPAVDTDEPLIQ
jgi:hypothetical protein